MEKSPLLTDRLYRRVLRISNRSVIETVHALEQEKQDYREYIESWIHEVKAPLTAVNLMCARKISEGGEEAAFFRKMLRETESMENAVEQALYYARSDEVYQDFLITPAASTISSVKPSHATVGSSPHVILCCSLTCRRTAVSTATAYGLYLS